MTPGSQWLAELGYAVRSLRRERLFATATIVTLAATTACGGAETPQQSVVTRDSAGITIVQNDRPTWTTTEALHLAPSPSLVIGNRPEPAYALSRVGGAAQLADGRIVVADGGSLQLRFFDSTGIILDSVGGRGHGPGEFTSLRDLSVLLGDTLAVRSGSWTVSFFDGRGRFLRRVEAFDPAKGMASGIKIIYAVLGDQALVIGPPPSPTPPGMVTRWVDSVPLTILRRDADAPAPLGTFPVMAMAREGTQPGPPWFGAIGVFVGGDSTLYAGYGDEYAIRELTPDGTVRRIIRRRWTPVRVTQHDIDTYAAEWVKHWGRGSSAAVEKQRRDLLDDAYAEEVPAFSQLIADRTSRLWVREPHLADAPGSGGLNSLPLVPSVWSVFDAQGRWLGDVTMPARFSPTDIGADYVLGVAVDADGVETVVRYALR